MGSFRIASWPTRSSLLDRSAAVATTFAAPMPIAAQRVTARSRRAGSIRQAQPNDHLRIVRPVGREVPADDFPDHMRGRRKIIGEAKFPGHPETPLLRDGDHRRVYVRVGCGA